LNYISLSDADSATALSFVEQKLKDADANVTFTKETKAYVERLGGRASDLETVRPVHSRIEIHS
jgi:AAA+ ATPase superfamily predicted ATPase